MNGAAAGAIFVDGGGSLTATACTFRTGLRSDAGAGAGGPLAERLCIAVREARLSVVWLPARVSARVSAEECASAPRP